MCTLFNQAFWHFSSRDLYFQHAFCVLCIHLKFHMCSDSKKFTENKAIDHKKISEKKKNEQQNNYVAQLSK